MSENKKYFYLKLKDSFFSSEEMLVLESLPDGLIYQNIYLRMCLLSLKNDGALTFKNMLPYDLKMLATVLRIDIAKMKLALEMFEELGLVTKTDNEVLFMSDIQTLIGKSSTEAERIASYRKRIAGCTKGVQMLQDCTPELKTDTELKKDTDTQIEAENECVPSYVQNEFIPKKEDVYIVGEMFNLLQAHNSSSPKHKIPISKGLFNFQCKEGRDILQLLKQDSPENILQALKNYLIVSNMESWKTSFSFGAFCKSFTEYTPEFFDISKYDKETDKEQICDNFIKQMEKEKDFDTGTFWQNRADWLEKGRPQGAEYYKWQKEKWHEMGLE